MHKFSETLLEIKTLAETVIRTS